MRSPFPGMDPYLERHWLHVHHALTTYAVDHLQGQLPKALRVRMEERIYVESEGEARRLIGPDVRVIERSVRQGARPGEESGGGTAVLEAPAPVILEYDVEPITEAWLQVIDVTSGNRVVTVIEFVSPTNKSYGEGRDLYLKKRTECFAAGVNFVEIDLTRTGNRYAGFLPFNAPPGLQQTYLAWARRATRPRRYELYPLSLRERLRPIGVPLREADADVTLELQPLIDQCYRNGGFDDIDYRADPSPPFRTDDDAWADALLRAAGAR